MTLRLRLTYRALLLLLVGFVTVQTASAQYGSEAEMIKAANKFFQNGEYKEALPLFSRALANNPKSADYNYKYGACAVFADNDREKAISHLKFASTKAGVDPGVYFFLGRAYHLNYRFDWAIENYRKFQQLADTKEKKRLQVGRNIEMCNNGKRLLKNITDLVVLEKKRMRESEFFRLYKLDAMGGKIIVKPDDLMSSMDKKKNDRSIIHLPDDSDMIFFSSYGKDGASGKDLFQVKRLPDGKWGKPQIVKGAVNTPYDEDYPYLHPNGTTLYFCSKGHNSMGGYDVYQSELNPNTGLFGPPENLDFAINTPDDDIFYIVDSLDNMAWFASGRASIQGELDVYKVRVKRIPVLTVIIKGVYSNVIDANDHDATITVEDDLTKEVVGIFKTNRKTGSYVITLPKSGKYNFLVDAGAEGLTHTGPVDVPYQEEIKALKQELQLVEFNGGEQLKILNMFDQDAGPVEAEFFVQKQNLDVNYDPSMEDLLMANGNDLEPKTIQDVLDDKRPNYTEEDIINQAFETAEMYKNEAEDNKEKLETAYYVANNKLNEANSLTAQAERLTEEAEGTTDEYEKLQKLKEAADLKKQAKLLLDEATVAYDLARNLEKRRNDKLVLYEDQFNFAKKLEAAINSESIADTEKLLDELIQRDLDVQKDQMQHVDVEEMARRKARKAEVLAQLQMERVNELSNDLDDVKRKLSGREIDYQREKKEKEREFIKMEIDQLRADKEAYEDEVESETKKFEQLEADSKNLMAQYELVKSFNEGSYTDVAVLDEQVKNSLAGSINETENRNDAIEIDHTLLAVGNRDYTPEDVLPDYKDRMTTIDMGDGSEADKAREKTRVNEELIGSLNDREAELTRTIAAEEDPERKAELERELTAVRDMRDNATQENEVFADVIANDVNTETGQEVVADNFVPNYDDRVETIDNGGGTDAEKAIAKSELNEELINNLNDRETELTDAIASENDPDKRSDLENELNDVRTLRDDKTQENDVLADVIANDVNTETGQEVVADNFVPNYDDRVETIDNGGGTDAEKAIAKSELNEELINNLNDRETELTDAIASENDPDKRSDLENELNDVRTLRDDKTQENDVLADVIANDVNTETGQEVVADNFVPNYDDRIETIDNGNGSDTEKAIAKSELNEELINNLNDREAELNVAIVSETDPDKRTDLENELADVRTLRDDKLQENDILADVIANDTNTEVVADNFVPNYDNRIETIDNGDGTAAEKAIAKSELNEELINNLNDRETELTDAIAAESDPDKRSDLENERNDVRTLRDDKTQENDVLADVIANDSNALETKDVIADNFLPNYDDRVNAIENGDGSDAEKAAARSDLNEELINNLLERENELTNAIGSTTDPDKVDAYEAELAELRTLRADKTQENDTLADVIANENNPDRGNVVIADNFVPNYNNRVEEIDNGPGSDADKAIAKAGINEELINNLNDRENELTDAIAVETDPDKRTNLENELDAVRTLRDDKTQENDVFADIVANGGVPTTDAEVTAEDIVPGYEEQINTIDDGAGTDVDKARLKTIINEELLTGLNDREATLTTQLANTSDPERRANIEAELTSVRDLRSDVERDNELYAGIIENNGSVPTMAGITPEEITSNYRDRMATIDNGAGSNDDKLTEKTRVQDEILADLDTQIADYQAELEATDNPDRKTELTQTIGEMVRVRSDIQTEREELIAARNGDINPTESRIATFDPNFEENWTSIDDSNGSERDKALAKTELANDLLSNIDNHLEELRTDLGVAEGTEEQTRIRQQIEEAETLREVVADRRTDVIEESGLTVAALNGQDDLSPVVTVEDLSNGFEQEKADIERSDDNEYVKATARTELNNDALEAIETELTALNTQYDRETDEETKARIAQRRDKVEEIKLEILQDNIRQLAIAEEYAEEHPEVLASNGTNNVIITPENGSERTRRNYDASLTFVSDDAKSAYDKYIPRNITAINDLRENVDIARAELESTEEGSKERTKAQAKLDKAEAALLAERVKAGENFARVNPVEFDENKANNEAGRADLIARGIDDTNVALNKAVDLEEASVQNKAEAGELRNQAKRAKTDEEKDELLSQAYEKEWLAIEQQRMATTIYDYLGTRDLTDPEKTVLSDRIIADLRDFTERTDTNLGDLNALANAGSGAAVNDDPSKTNKSSDDWMEDAARLNMESTSLYNRAAELRDSATTVKKKYRDAIIEDAERLERQADLLEQEADIAVEEAERQEDIETAEAQADAKIMNDPMAIVPPINAGEIPAYNEYIQIKVRGDNYTASAQRDEDEADRIRREADRQAQEAADLINNLDQLETDDLKAEAIKESNRLNEMASDNYDKANELDKTAERKYAKADVIYEEATDYMASLDAQMSAEVVAAVERNYRDDPTVASNNTDGGVVDPVTPPIFKDQVEDVLEVPDLVTEELFARTNEPVYSDNNPIPVDTKGPNGLYYKVQVGAFRNPIPQDHFSEFAPVTGEKTSSGLTRYTVGYFTRYATADNAKTEVRGIGYSDAFVVAFYNGERIPLVEARRIQEEGGDVNALADLTINNTNPVDPRIDVTDPRTDVTNPRTDVTDPTIDPNAGNYYNDTNAAPANQVETISGMFYTVQIGVYSKPVPSSTLYNIKPLNSEQLSNGNIRYTTGVYTDLNVATSRKNEIVEIGIRDAFVTAYHNGKKITVAEARQLLAENGNSVLADPNNVTVSNNTNAGTNNNETPPSNENITDPVDNNSGTIRFKVYLGEYVGEVPVEESKVILQMMHKGIDREKVGDKTTYTSGNFTNFNAADELKGEFQEAGLSGVKVIAEQDGNPISVEEARRLLNQ